MGPNLLVKETRPVLGWEPLSIEPMNVGGRVLTCHDHCDRLWHWFIDVWRLRQQDAWHWIWAPISQWKPFNDMMEWYLFALSPWFSIKGTCRKLFQIHPHHVFSTHKLYIMYIYIYMAMAQQKILQSGFFENRSIHWNLRPFQPTVKNSGQTSTAVGPCGCFSPLTARRRDPVDPG